MNVLQLFRCTSECVLFQRVKCSGYLKHEGGAITSLSTEKIAKMQNVFYDVTAEVFNLSIGMEKIIKL
jgi:hypothetical protein